MINSEIRTIRYDNGEMQRYQILSGFAWNDIEFVQAPFTKETFEEIVRMYQAFVIPKHSFLYGAFVIFHLPEGVESPFPLESDAGIIFDKQVATCYGLEKLYREGRIRNTGSSLEIDDENIRVFLEKLEKEGWLRRQEGGLLLPSRRRPWLSQPYRTDSSAYLQQQLLHDGPLRP